MRHILTAPRSPTTTGKIERFHKTLRAEFFNLHVFETIEEAQAGLDAWVAHYNYERDHQSIGDVPPATRFALAAPVIVASVAEPSRELPERSGPPPATRRVDATGSIGLARHHYHVGRWLAGGTVEVHCHDSLVEIVHRDQLVVTHVARHQPDAASSDASRSNPDPLVPALRRSPTAWSSLASSTEEAQSASPVTPTRSASSGPDAPWRWPSWPTRVQFSSGGEVIRTHPIRHDRRKELGAFSTPNGRPRKAKAAG